MPLDGTCFSQAALMLRYSASCFISFTPPFDWLGYRCIPMCYWDNFIIRMANIRLRFISFDFDAPGRCHSHSFCQHAVTTLATASYVSFAFILSSLACFRQITPFSIISFDFDFTFIHFISFFFFIIHFHFLLIFSSCHFSLITHWCLPLILFIFDAIFIIYWFLRLLSFHLFFISSLLYIFVYGHCRRLIDIALIWHWLHLVIEYHFQ